MHSSSCCLWTLCLADVCNSMFIEPQHANFFPGHEPHKILPCVHLKDGESPWAEAK